MIRAILFDFDGVLVESAVIKTRAFRRLFAEHADALDKIIAYHLANTGVSRFVKFRHIFEAILHVPLSAEVEAALGERFSDLVLQEVLEAPLVPGALDFLETYRNKYLFFVVSGTPEQELRSIADRRRLSPFFLEIHGSPEKKADIIAGILSRHSLRGSEAVVVGDAETDKLAACANGVPFILRITGENKDLASECRLTMPDLAELELLLTKISEVYSGSNSGEEIS